VPELHAVHPAAAMPYPDEYAPAPQYPHWKKDDRPTPTQYLPGTANMHELLDEAPTVDEYEPEKQDVQAVVPPKE
jgi:hypothetical protein